VQRWPPGQEVLVRQCASAAVRRPRCREEGRARGPQAAKGTAARVHSSGQALIIALQTTGTAVFDVRFNSNRRMQRMNPNA
jgi:hypothetical protein